MEVKKERDGGAVCAAADGELEEINRFAKAELTAEQVYTFAVRLCDNEVDRDFERFDEQALRDLGKLFLGKTGIFDHRWSAEGQTARIYRTEVVQEPETRTKAGDGYCYLKGWAYLLCSEKNKDLIAEIEGGIKKEVSVGCSVKKSVCSICGGESGTCEHVRGRTYGGRLCFAELREPTDAYEWSFVAVPAQPKAGVMKQFFAHQGGPSRGEWDLLQKQAELGRSYLAALRKEVLRLALLADEDLDGTLFAGMAEKLEEGELLELKRSLESRVNRLFPLQPQLKQMESKADENGESAFLI